jgi:hypothetical protein
MEYYKQMLSDKLRLEEILVDSGMTLLLVMVMPEMSKPGREKSGKSLSLRQLERFSGLSRVTIHRTLNRGMAAAAIRKDGGNYRISESMTSLREFLKHFAFHAASERLKEISVTCGIEKDLLNILFVSGSEFIFSSPRGSEIPEGNNVFPTGLTAFEHDGLEFMTNCNYYHFPGNRHSLGCEDHLVDMLLIDPLSSRNVLYSLLYLKKNFPVVDKDYLLSLGDITGLSDSLRDMLEFLSKEQAAERFPGTPMSTAPRKLPSYGEFKELSRLYGLDDT